MKTQTYLTNMKSRYFMLVACLILILGTVACSTEDFGTDLPEQEKTFTRHGKTYTKQELIEMAWGGEILRTRTTSGGFSMTTIKDTVFIRCDVNQDVELYLDDDPPLVITKNNSYRPYTFSSKKLSHKIQLVGPKDAIEKLYVYDGGLISLKVSENTNLTTLSCSKNYLDELNLENSININVLYIDNNEFTSIDISCLPQLKNLCANNNRLRELDFSQNRMISDIFISNNRITNLDLSKASNLTQLEVQNNPLQTIDLTASTELANLNVSYTQLTALDLSNNTNLWWLFLENVPLRTLNRQLISATSFNVFSMLTDISIAHTSFLTSLDLSDNPYIYFCDISNSTVADLKSDISIRQLYTTRSEFKNWECDSLPYLFELRIESTPFEKNRKSMIDLNFMLPTRSKNYPGYLYTYSPYIDELTTLTSRNWVINP